MVRSGPNTLLTYHDPAVDRRIEDDDIVYLDFGPVFDAWEADFGRTYALGTDPHKQRLIVTITDQGGPCDGGHWQDPSWYQGGFKNVFNDPSDASPKSDFTMTIEPKTDIWLHVGRSLVTGSGWPGRRAPRAVRG